MLQHGLQNCFVLHIGNTDISYPNMELCVDGWNVQEDDSDNENL